MTIHTLLFTTHPDRHRGVYSEHLQLALSQAFQALMGLSSTLAYSYSEGPRCIAVYIL